MSGAASSRIIIAATVRAMDPERTLLGIPSCVNSYL